MKKRGPKPKPAGERHSVRFLVPLMPSERRGLDAKARKADVSGAELMRRALAAWGLK